MSRRSACSSRQGWRLARSRVRYPGATSDRSHVTVGGQAPGGEYDGDISQIHVVRLRPSVLRQIAIAKTEPGDENNQDISSLVGKVDIRKLEHFAQHDADAYSYSGGLCLANQGLLEFVEMFKAPIKVLHPLLTATQEGNFKGTEGLAAIPFDGLIWPTRTSRNGRRSATTATTRPSSTASISSRCPTACGFPRKCVSTRSCSPTHAGRRALRARYAAK
jgi:hypothetical protein